MGKLILLDGHSLANRAFYALPRLTAASGQVTNAVYGFLTMLLRLIDEERPEMIAAAFDRPAPTFRHTEFDGYKATRTAAPEDFKSQIPIIKEALEALGIPVFELDGYEADDVLGTISSKATERGIETVIVTGDRDALQLVSDKTTVLLTRKGISEVAKYDRDQVEAAYNIAPSQVVDVKALTGDASDNIPGVQGIGEKTALRLIREFGSVERLLESLDKVEDNRARAALERGARSAVLSKRLATIVRDVPLEVDFEACRLKPPDLDRIDSLFQGLDFKNMARRVRESYSKAGFSGRARDGEPEARATIRSNWEHVGSYSTPRTAAELGDAVERAARSEVVALAFVHAGATEQRAPMSAVFAKAATGSFYLRMGDGEGEIPRAEALSVLGRLLENARIAKVGHAVKPSLVWLRRSGADIRGLRFDTALAGYLLDPTRSSYRIADLAKEYLGVTVPEPEKGEPVTGDHAAARAAAALALSRKMDALLEDLELKRLFCDIEMPLLEVLADMEVTGVGVDPSMVENMSREFACKIDSILREIYSMAGTEFNVNSTRQLGEVLFDRLGLPRTKRTKTGYSTDAEVLEELAGRHEIAAKILEYRQVQKLKGTYLDGILDLIDRATCRVHTTFNQTVTATGRISSAEPNLQNIPVRMELGRLIRKIFVPREGCVLVAGDYSQIELRVLAHISKDPTLIESFLRGEDIHRRTASEVFGVPVEEVTPEMRSKAVNFGIVYGMSDFGLSQNLGVPRGEAKAYIDGYLSRYPGVRAYMETTIGQARKNGYVTTIFKRRRYLPDINSPNRNLRMFAERTAINTPIQGTAADIIKKAMVGIAAALRDAGLRSKMILQVHDELVFEVPEEEVEVVSRIVRDGMEHAADLLVPLSVEMKLGANWYDMRPL
ncbi:MAG: DNA polymerase I [Firmicutes bacterium]|nr:DNA polymerase I [Bacillota bacterium]